MADPKSKIVKGGLSAAKRLLMTEEEKLAQKYAAGAQYADPLAPATMRMSEALGNVGAEGKTLNFTEADRSRVFGSNRGGVGFSGLQHYSLPHKNANTVWGFGNKTTAEKKVKQNDPEKSIWTTFVGSPNQHKSNTVVLKDAIKEFQNAVKSGNVPAGQIKLMNDRIRAATDDKTGVLLFDDAFDLTDPSALGAANSFARRSAVGDVLLGEGVKGEMRRKAFKEENKGETWKDSGQMDSILRRETDPDLIDAGTYDVGNRFFVMDGKIIERPDLNEAFPLQVTGTDLGIKYQLVPPNKAMRDFYKSREGRKDKNDRPSPVNYYDLSRAEPSQFVDEDFLTFLQKEGYKKGGAVNIKQSDARLNAAIANRMAKGGKVDIKAADARLAQAMAQRMAQGGEAGLKKLEFMAEGGAPMQAGGIAKGAAKGFKKLFAERDVLPVESQAAKQARLNMMPTARIGLEAPGILIPSKMNNVREAVRNMKGNYGARRVERAADEIPNLERMYQEDALKQAFTGDNAAAMMTIDPSRFEEFATPIGSTFTRPNSVRHTSAGDRVTFPEYLDYLKSLEGFDDVPFLEINKQLQGTMAKPYISGHEGRHRNRAMSQSGEKAGLVQLLPRSELREPFPRRTQEEYIEALKKELEMTGNIVLPQINKNQPNLPQRPAIDLPDIYAEGGSVFKTLQFKDAQHFDGGGIASPEESSGYSAQPFMSGKRWSDIKKNAAEMWDETKKTLGSDYDRLKSSPRARAQLAKIAGMQLAGGAPDLAHLGVDLIVDPLKSVTVDKLLTKPAYRSVLEGPLKAGEKQERVPMFGSISDALKTEDGLPIGGSEHLIKRAQDAGLMSQGRFHPLTEIPAAIAGGLGVSKLGKVASKGYQKNIEPRVDPAGALSRAITDDSNSLLPSFTKNPLYAPQSVKLTGLQPEVKTASTGTPQGATYATKQEGPFYRVSPTTLDVSGAKSRGLREADELQGQAPVGGTAGEAGREVPLRISDEEVARLIADPASNQPLQIAQRFTKETQGTDFVVPEIPESSLAKQSAIGRAHQLAVEGSPEYKSAVFDAYAKQMPDLLEQVGAKNYDDLMEKAYRQLAKETDEQFKQLPYNFSYHRAGEGDYKSSKEMMADVHGNKHLYVFQGGDPHDFLNRLDKASGLNENEKFRAVHDLLGHAIYGNQFGPKGEEIAWAIHQQMYSPLARLAMTAETRGQNSLVNYSPLNVSLKSNIAKLEDLEVEALRRKDTALVNEIRAAKRQEFANNFQFAPQKAVLLPPEFVDPKFAGGMPDYLSAANRPAKGTETQSVLTHFSNDPNLQLLDPTRYGTGIKGAEAERLREYAGGVKDRSYVYLGEPGTVSPESGLGVNRYRGESQNLYDITKDPLGFRPLARESNRTPFTAKYNAGITHPLQEANDYERLVKEYGYEGMINPNASKPMGIMFKPTPVQPRKRGGLTQLKAR
jgi:hypothetical protein